MAEADHILWEEVVRCCSWDRMFRWQQKGYALGHVEARTTPEALNRSQAADAPKEKVFENAGATKAFFVVDLSLVCYLSS